MSRGPRIPEVCGALLAEPAVAALGSFVHGASAVARERWSTAPAEARLDWESGRVELLTAAHAETREAGGEVLPTSDATGPVLVTGHQPALYHGGVWLKNFIVDAVCRASGLVGVNVTVDADLATPEVMLPVLEGQRWRRVPVALPEIGSGLPWSSQPPLTPAGWRALVGVLRGKLASTLRDTVDAFADCVQAAPAVARARTLAESLSRARRAWEGVSGAPSYLELPLSAMCATHRFRTFVASVLVRLPEFWHIHNECLARYRQVHRIRTGAHPVPDLRRRDDLWETPFWCIHPDGGRAGLFLERCRTSWKVMSRDAVLGVLADAEPDDWPLALSDMLARGRMALRPRALTLTMFVRRALADVFLHGVGGARYEPLGDEISTGFFGTAAAPWAVASGSLCVWGHDGATTDVAGETAREVKRYLRDLQHNPQRFAPHDDLLAARKRALVIALAAARGVEKRRLNDELDGVDAALRQQLAPLRAELVRRRAEAEERDGSRAALHWRGYPFPLLRPERLRARVEEALEEAR